MLEKDVRPPPQKKKNSFLLAARSVPEERGEEVGVPDSPKLYQIETTVLFNGNKILLLPFPQSRRFLSLPFLRRKKTLAACLRGSHWEVMEICLRKNDTEGGGGMGGGKEEEEGG